jgi:hypothetical protein
VTAFRISLAECPLMADSRPFLNVRFEKGVTSLPPLLPQI